MQQPNILTAMFTTMFTTEARRIERLRRAAWGVMRTHPSAPGWPTAERSLMVASWVEEALEARRERLEHRREQH